MSSSVTGNVTIRARRLARDLTRLNKFVVIRTNEALTTMDGFELQDELNALAQDSQNYEIPNEHDFSSEDPTRLLEGEHVVLCNLDTQLTDYKQLLSKLSPTRAMLSAIQRSLMSFAAS